MLAPEPTSVPPQLPVYHCQLAAVPRLPPLAESVAVPPEHTLVVVVLMELAAVDGWLILRTTPEHAVVLQMPIAFTK
jgi:hypothetical protein